MSSRSRVVLNNIEALVLAQATWEHGANSWPAVAKILSKHPLIKRPKSFFTAQTSHLMYENLLKEAEITRTEASDAVHSAENKSLAEKFYRARVEELRALILEEERSFKTILSEIETIRSGNFDASITARINGVPLVLPQVGHESKVSQPTADEIFGGSELTGATVTPASPFQSRETPPLPETPQEPTSSLEEPSADVSLPSTGEAEVQVVGDAGHKGNEEQPIIVEPAASDLTPEAETESCPEDNKKLPGEDEDGKREEEEEEEEAVEKEVESETPRATDDAPEEEEEEEEVEREIPQREIAAGESPVQEIDVTETPEATKEPTLPPPEDEPPHEQASETSVPEVEAELGMEDGESSGEEPLHARRSTRRRSTLSPAMPLQSTRKSRRQRAESPAKEEAKADQIVDEDDTQGGTPNVEADDASPAPFDNSTRRREGTAPFGLLGSDIPALPNITGKRKASVVDSVDSPRERKRARDDSEPADEDEPGPSHSLRGGRRPTTRSEEQVALKRFQNVIGMVHSSISQHRNGNIFHNPIKNSEAPDYREIVKRPIDLKTIKTKVKEGTIANSLEYQRDIFLMFANAMMYNRPGSEVHTMAEDMMIESERQILNFRQTEGLVRHRS
ncbi:hypothetical protein DXG03_000377 [Asterophora parasitica]|uniref:Bromo domain-containing protein n=1 Tax=Asterophora parasitica TaxID=117018 RepID=A0A9P7GFD4_9AGAR|nr:hypothetical protein DXG03_000377 [Asterophora parasitica]